MPMGGAAQRFKDVGVNTPKPMLKVNGHSLFERSLGSVLVPFIDEIKTHDIYVKITCVVYHEDDDTYFLENFFKTCVQYDFNINPSLLEVQVVRLSEHTKGSLQTALNAEIEDRDSVLVLDCDLEFKSTQYIEMIRSIIKEYNTITEGLLLSFYSDQPCYSYAETDDNYKVLRTAEKEVISEHALVGAYFVSSGEKFKFYGKQILENNDTTNGEFYTSLIFNKLIDDGNIVQLCDEIRDYHSFGTPGEFINNSNAPYDFKVK